jgi:hypothetical protein
VKPASERSIGSMRGSRGQRLAAGLLLSPAQLEQRLANPPALALEAFRAELARELDELEAAQGDSERTAEIRKRLLSLPSDLGHFLGVISAQSTRGLEHIDETAAEIATAFDTATLLGASTHIADDTRALIANRANLLSLGEAANAWTWVKREEWSDAAERYPSIARAADWLERRDDAHVDSLRGSLALWTAEQLADDHDLTRDALIASIDFGQEVPAAARDRLTSVVRDKLRAIVTRARRLGDRELLPLDAAFLDVLGALGKQGKSDAQEIAQSIPDRVAERGTRWYGWLPEVRPVQPPRRLRILVRAVWHDVVQPEHELEAKRIERRRPAVVRAVAADRLLPLITRQAMLPELDDGTVCDDKGRVLARIALTTDATLEAVRRGAHALGTVCGNRLIRSLIHRSHDAWNRGEQDPRKVAYEGGWTGLLHELGVSLQYQQQVKDIAKAGQCIVWETPNAKHGGLWLWSERRGTKAARGEVSFVLGDALTPGYGDELARTGGSSLPARIARRLVPELRFEPPMGGARDNEQGAIWTLHRLALVELVDSADELAKDGFVIISPGRWRELAGMARLPLSVLERTLAAWVAGENERAPQLLDRSDDGWTLADPHEPEREFIAQGGAKRLAGQKRNKDGARKRKSRS